MKIKKPKLLLFSILLTQGAGFIGSIATASSVDTWYQGITKPAFTPPSWVFAPVWITLFLLMAISLYRVWVKGKMKLVRLFLVHLVFNILWSYLFFGLRKPGLAFIDIIFLDLFVAYLIYRFYNVERWTVILLLPYLLWSMFASYLNFTIWILN